MTLPGIEHQPPRWETGDYLLDLWHARMFSFPHIFLHTTTANNFVDCGFIAPY
jgi:hypothetical protein